MLQREGRDIPEPRDQKRSQKHQTYKTKETGFTSYYSSLMAEGYCSVRGGSGFNLHMYNLLNETERERLTASLIHFILHVSQLMATVSVKA